MGSSEGSGKMERVKMGFGRGDLRSDTYGMSDVVGWRIVFELNGKMEVARQWGRW